MKHSHTSWRSLLTTASLLFGLFFGAGNLIFPLHLGQLAGKNWLPAAVGFLITGALLPLFSVLAIALTDAEGVYDVAKPLGPVFALTFMILVHLAIGPAFGTPRTATVAFTVGVAPFLSHAQEKVGLLIFSALFFTAAFAVSYHENKIATQVGKLLNPLFLGLLFLVFLVCFLNPLGRPSTAPVSGVFQHGATLHGFLEGYATHGYLGRPGLWGDSGACHQTNGCQDAGEKSAASGTGWSAFAIFGRRDLPAFDISGRAVTGAI